MEKSAYARAGVDYSKLEPFKMAMIEVGKQTLEFPNTRGVYINADVLHSHGAVFEYRGDEPHIWVKTQEGLGNKNWIAEWMYAKTGKSYYDSIAIDTALMAVNDVIAQGALPVVFTDHIEASDSEWFADEVRNRDLAAGFLQVCEESGMALPAGESAPLKYLVKPEPPVVSAPSLSGSVTGIVAPASRLVTGRGLSVGDAILGAPSSGIHANGISLVIKHALELPEQFLTKLPNGKTLGENVLTPTRSYVALVEALAEAQVEIHAFLPGTGDGVGKLAFDKRPFTYRVRDWPQVPELFRYFHEQLGVGIEDCLKTFNWGIGYYAFVPHEEAERALLAGKRAGYDLRVVGVVEEGERQVIFEPERVILNPPGE
jgi:phosphoribosylformylglycinamidine cyclo-ligase